MTLFGEEIVPEQPKAAARARARKGTDSEPAEQAAPVPEEITDKQPEAPATIVPQEAMTTIPEPAAIEATPAPAEAAVTDTTPAATEPEALSAPAGPKPQPAPKKKKPKAEGENIILPEDWQGDKQYYSIGEVADLFKVNTSHIRFWTNEFKLKVRTTRKGDRLFTPEQIRELRAIHHLVKERGFTLSGARAKLKEQNSVDVQTVDLKQSLLQLRNKLIIIKDQLT